MLPTACWDDPQRTWPYLKQMADERICPYLSLHRADLLECVRHMVSRRKEPREEDWVRVQRVRPVGQYL
eukprot:5565849-Amphidinium_carterae.1